VITYQCDRCEVSLKTNAERHKPHYWHWLGMLMLCKECYGTASSLLVEAGFWKKSDE
jgi:hypothetical protein